MLSGCTFYGAKFDRETFKGAILDETIMPNGIVLSSSKNSQEQVLFGAKDSVLEVDPDSVIYTAALQEQTPGRFAYGTKLRRGLALVSGTNARGRNLSGFNLSDLSLDGSDFRDADLTGADLGGTSFVASQLDDLIAIGADFVNGSISGSSAQGAVFDDTNWNFSSLANADLMLSLIHI